MEGSLYEDVRRGHGEVDGAFHAFFAFNALLSLNFSFVRRVLRVFGLFGLYVMGWSFLSLRISLGFCTEA
jgi:hypothetical protein